MESITHEQLVKALVKHPLEIIQTLSQYTADLWHGATGVAGEGGELLEAVIKGDVPNVIEELGDLEFYMEQLRQCTGLKRRDDMLAEMEGAPYNVANLMSYAAWAAVHAAAVLDTCKKAAIYNKPLDLGQLEQDLFHLDGDMGGIRSSLSLTREQTIAANIAKLRKRYPELAYTDKAAQDRADKQNEPVRKFIGQPQRQEG